MFRIRMSYEIHITFNMLKIKIFPIHMIKKKNLNAFPTKYFQKIIILFGLSQGLQALIIPRKWMNIYKLHTKS